jgi:hypothetical protein
MMEVPNVRINQYLLEVVVDKAVTQGVEIRENRNGNQHDRVHQLLPGSQVKLGRYLCQQR